MMKVFTACCSCLFLLGYSTQAATPAPPVSFTTKDEATTESFFPTDSEMSHAFDMKSTNMPLKSDVFTENNSIVNTLTPSTPAEVSLKGILPLREELKPQVGPRIKERTEDWVSYRSIARGSYYFTSAMDSVDGIPGGLFLSYSLLFSTVFARPTSSRKEWKLEPEPYNPKIFTLKALSRKGNAKQGLYLRKNTFMFKDRFHLTKLKDNASRFAFIPFRSNSNSMEVRYLVQLVEDGKDRYLSYDAERKIVTVDPFSDTSAWYLTLVRHDV